MRHRRGIGFAFLMVGLTAAIVTAASAEEPAASPGLESILDECSRLTLASKGRHIKDKLVTIGHLEVSFTDGTLVPVLGKSGSTLGAYFVGRGGYVYRTDDDADQAALEINATRLAGALRPVDGRVNDTFKQLLFLFSEPQFTELGGGDSAEEAAPESMKAAFQPTLAGALNTYGEFDFRTALARLNGRGRWVYAEFSGGLVQAGYAYDDVLDGRERVFTFRKLADYPTRFSETLSVQSLQGWNAQRRTSIVLTKADLDVATADNRAGTINSNMTFRVHDIGTRLIALNLFNSHDPDAGTWNSPRHKLTVNHVLDGDGKDLPFSHKYGELMVEIPTTQAADSDVRLRFETEGDVFLDMSWRHTDNYFTLGYTDWYPAPTNWAGQQFTYTLKVKCKKPWRPVMSGKEVLLKEAGDFMVAESRSDHPSALVTVLAGKYVTHAATIDGVTVRIHAYAMARKNVLDNMPKLAIALVKFYTAVLGPMSGDELDIVEVPEYGFGISPSGVILLTTEAYKPHQDEIANYLARGINARLAHEIAHQWFGHKAIPADLPDGWISESFAEYFSGLAMASLAGSDRTIFGFTRMLADWKAENKYCTGGAPISTASYLGGEKGRDDRRCLLYSRGPLVLHMLRTSIGNDRFNAATRKFLDGANNGPATTGDYAKAVSEVVQMDMNWYFDQWVRKSGNAHVDVDQHMEPATNGQFRLWGVMRQTPGQGFKKLLVPLVWDNGGKPEARVVFADQPEKTFEFLLPTKPGSIKPDPFENNLATYK
jgi:hypothetical protein